MTGQEPTFFKLKHGSLNGYDAEITIFYRPD